MDWCRLWHDLPNDPKWRTIAKISQQPVASVISVYIHLLVQASANATERGRTQPNAEDLASALDLQNEHVEAILAAMQGRVMHGNRLSGWNKRQPSREDGSAERSRKWRHDKQLRESSEVANATERNRTQMNGRRDGDETETRRDGEVLVVNDLLPATEVLSVGRDSEKTDRPTEDRFQFMKSALTGYMQMNGNRPNAKPPDDAIVNRCLAAINGTDLRIVGDFLRDRYVNRQQSPAHANGPKKYAWFEAVLAEEFGGHK